MSRLARHLWTSDSQFGIKRAHETEIAIFTFKQAVGFYRNQDTPVYMCFLDVKKAFDRVNHWTLATKLSDRNVFIFGIFSSLVSFGKVIVYILV